jgi:hypothetical protein
MNRLALDCLLLVVRIYLSLYVIATSPTLIIIVNITLFFPPLVQQPLVGQGLLIIEASRSRSDNTLSRTLLDDNFITGSKTGIQPTWYIKMSICTVFPFEQRPLWTKTVTRSITRSTIVVVVVVVMVIIDATITSVKM